MKRFLAVLLCSVTLLTAFAGCGEATAPGTPEPAPQAATEAATAAEAPTEAAPAEAVHDTDYDDLDMTVIPEGFEQTAAEMPIPEGHTVVNLWYSVSGAAGDTLNELVIDFNNTVGAKKKIWVVPTFQGDYVDAQMKLESVFLDGDTSLYPDLVNIAAEGVVTLIDTPEFTMLQELIDQDPDFPLADLGKDVVETFSYKDVGLTSFPLAVNAVFLYYNKDMFREAGLDPEQPPKTLAELAEMAPKFVKKNDAGDVDVYGFGCSPRYMHMHNWIGMQNAYITDMRNGRDGAPTRFVMGENGSLETFLTEWKKVVDSGAADYFSDPGVNMWRNQKTAMMILSSVQTGNLRTTPVDFDWGIAAMPRVNLETDQASSMRGGSTVFVVDRGEEQKNAAYAFLKFLAQPKPSAKWLYAAGYFPANNKAYDFQESKDVIAQYPQLSLYPGIANTVTEGEITQLPLWVPALNELSVVQSEAMIRFGNGELDLNQTIETIVNDSNAALDNYHRLNG